MASVRVGCDIGGTFTDLVLVDDDAGATHVAKVPSTPDDFTRGVLAGLDAILERSGSTPERVTYLVHSTTIGINTLIERTGTRVGLLTTEGFRDVLEIGRASRQNEYDFFQVRPEPLVPRWRRLAVRERMDQEGREETPLDRDGVRAAAAAFEADGVEAIAVAFLHAYANPAHEQQAAEVLRERLPGVPLSLSSDVNPVYREYERTSTTVVDAYVGPRVVRYLDRLEHLLRERGYRCPLHIVQSSGGVMTAEAARARPVEVLMAGPAAGAAAAVHIARRSNLDGAVALDTGGTTQLVSVVRGGTVRPSIESRLEGYPVRVPMVDVRPVGAGGGSLARVDEGGMLRVGPESAGADPGPACYGRGGREPTVTDADVVLGYLNPDRFLGGRLRLDAEQARQAIAERVGTPLGLDVVEAASGIVQVVDTARVSAIRRVLIEQGLDPRDFSLVAFGGAGPVHAARLAAELRMASVIVPLHPGLASPIGALTGDLRRDFVRTVGASVDRVPMSRLRDLAAELRGRAAAELAEHVDEVEVAADMKYGGQLHETVVPLAGVAFADEDREQLRQRFLDEHRRLYGYAIEQEGVDLVNLRVVARRRFPALPEPNGEPGDEDPAPGQVGERAVHFAERGTLPTPVFDRERLRPGNRLDGPAIIEEYDSTAVVPPGQTCRVDPHLQLVITAGGGAP